MVAVYSDLRRRSPTARPGVRQPDPAELAGRACVRRRQDGGGAVQRGGVPHVDRVGGVVKVHKVMVEIIDSTSLPRSVSIQNAFRMSCCI